MIGAIRSSRQKKMSDANHLSGPLRKHEINSKGLKRHGLRFVIGGFWSVLWLSVFQGSLLVIVMMTNGSEKRNCEGGFWALEVAFFLKAQRPSPTEYILQWFTQQNHQCDNTHCLNHKSYLHFSHKRDFYTHEQTRTWVYLKASLVATKHKPIPLKFIHHIRNCVSSLSFNLTMQQVTKFLRNISLCSRHLRTKSLEVVLWPKLYVNIPNWFSIDFIHGLQTSKVR